MTNKVWWGEFSIAEQQHHCWQIGDRAIIIKRLKNEWNSWNIETKQETDGSIVHQKNCAMPALELSEDKKIFGRYLQQNSAEKIQVFPLLADRSIVARPSSPLTLLAGEKARLYVSTPIWFCVETLPKKTRLLDVPFWRPSDSWFGSSTMAGQLCYAKYTTARLQLDNIEKRSHRAITPITVVNHHTKALTIDRINVPVTLLNLFFDQHQQLWTTAITIKRENEGNNVELNLDHGAPAEALTATLIGAARDTAEHNTLIRNISSLFG
ncbi:DUF432 domain-containing protein [Thalassotalea agariperforans]